MVTDRIQDTQTDRTNDDIQLALPIRRACGRYGHIGRSHSHAVCISK
jgi:hypothetical protein